MRLRMPKLKLRRLRDLVRRRDFSRQNSSERIQEACSRTPDHQEVAEEEAVVEEQEVLEEPIAHPIADDEAEERDESAEEVSTVADDALTLCPPRESQMQKELEETREELAILQHQHQDLEQRNKTLEREARHLRRKLHETDRKLEAATTVIGAAPIPISPPKPLVLPATDSQGGHDSLAHFYVQVRDWAAGCGVESLHGTPASLGDRVRREVLAQLKGAAAFPSWKSLEGFKYPFLILAAVLAKHLHDWVFNNPFFNYWDPEKPNISLRYIESLRPSLDNMLWGKPVNARKDEASLVRASIRDWTLSDDSKNSPSSTLEHLTAALYHKIVYNFLYSAAARLLLKPEKRHPKSYQESLLILVREAGGIALRLALRKKFYSWEYPELILNQKFTARSDYYNADILNRVQDKKDDKCDGMPIRIVLSHAVRDFGSDDKWDYSNSRLVAKAVVWVDDREEEIAEEEL